MIALAPWQALLNGLGWVLGEVYELIPNYGVTIIVLTLLIRFVLLPLGIKQIRSMQHMQAIQPKLKALQQKYKGNRQKLQEEQMKLYREYGVNPFSGCWPVLLQFPILIAMYSVLRQPSSPPHLPADSSLQQVINVQLPPEGPTKEAPSASGTDFLGANLLCSAIQAGRPAELVNRSTAKSFPVDCGDSIPSRIPYYVFAVLMFGTTYLQQRQMQNASPPGAQSQQQQLIMKIFPLMFGVFGFTFPAGLVLYWTTSNAWQIGQQYFMLRRRPSADALAEMASKKPAKRGFFAGMMERAEGQRQDRESGTVRKPPPRKPGTSSSKPGSKPPAKKPNPDGQRPGTGGTSATRNRKKRPKR